MEIRGMRTWEQTTENVINVAMYSKLKTQELPVKMNILFVLSV